MFAASATHRGAPFVGRARERGLLLHLLQEGLEGSLAQVRVAGPPGIGRRRLIAEVLRHGPDAEWIHLAPGGVEADLPRWIRTELLDLLDTYPEAPVPSWSLHVLGRWAPALHARARTPLLGREPLPPGRLPEVVGAAIAALLLALTGRTLVVVDAGLWPDPASAGGRALAALAGALRVPGAVLLAAVGPEEARLPDWGGTRTLELGPLAADEVASLVTEWTGSADDPSEAFAAWLARVSGGHPLCLHETVRWLEEMGHLRVDEERGEIELLDPLDRLPIPLTLHAVLDARYGRLPPASARLLHLLTRADGRLEIEAVRLRSGEDDETFEEAIAILRRREFLLQRSSRRPLALATPLWREVAEAGALRYSRHAHREPAAAEAPHGAPNAPLARILEDLDAIRRNPEAGDSGAVLARVARRLAGRTGAAWDGARGRLAVLAARRRLREGRPAAAALWARWGLRHLDPDRHPALRRTLFALDAERLEITERPGEAVSCRDRAWREAIEAGHAVHAARILAAHAEGLRRLGRLEEGGRLAAGAEDALARMGLPAAAALAGYTRVSALLDARRLDEVSLALAEIAGDETEPGWTEIRQWLDALEAAPLRPVFRTIPAKPWGWGWGLDLAPSWRSSRQHLRRLGIGTGRYARNAIRRLSTEADAMAEVGYTTAAADMEELRLGLILEETSTDPGPAIERTVARVLALQTPSRLRALAEALRETRAAELDVVHRTLTPLRVHMDPPPPQATRLRLVLMGRPRVVNRDGAVPVSLWPEWWRHLALQVISADLLGEPLPRKAAESILAHAHDSPAGGLPAALHAGNSIWGGRTERAEGIHLQGDRLVVSWDGMDCDARTLLRLSRDAEAAHATAPEEALRLWEAVLDAAGGGYLPGVAGTLVTRARHAVDAATSRALAARRALHPDPDSLSLWRWLEHGSAADVAAYAAEVSARRGRTHLARALEPGSP